MIYTAVGFGIGFESASEFMEAILNLHLPFRLRDRPRFKKAGILGYQRADGAVGGGRGTSEMKTNDITGRYGDGQVGIRCEMGRPGEGFYFREMEKVTMTLAKFGDGFEEKNPINVFIDPKTGQIRKDFSEI